MPGSSQLWPSCQIPCASQTCHRGWQPCSAFAMVAYRTTTISRPLDALSRSSCLQGLKTNISMLLMTLKSQMNRLVNK